MPNFALKAANQKLYRDLAQYNNAVVTRRICSVPQSETGSYAAERTDGELHLDQSNDSRQPSTPVAPGAPRKTFSSPAHHRDTLISTRSSSTDLPIASNTALPSSSSSRTSPSASSGESPEAIEMAPALSDRLQTAELLEQLRDMVLNTSSRSSARYQNDRYREDRTDSFKDEESYRRDRGSALADEDSSRRLMASLERKIEELGQKLSSAEKKSPSSPEVSKLRQQLAERNAALRAAEEALEADRAARLTAGRPARQVYGDSSGTLGAGLALQPNTFERTDALVEALQIKAEALQNKVNMLEAKAASATKHQSMVQKEKNDMEAQLADLQRKLDLEYAGRARLEEELKVAVQQAKGDLTVAREVEQLRARNRQLVKDLDMANAKSRANHAEATKALDKVKSIRREADGLTARVQELESQRQNEEDLLSVKEQLKASLQQRDEENERLRKERRIMKEEMSSLREKYNILQRAEESRLRAEAKLEEQKYRNMAFGGTIDGHDNLNYKGSQLGQSAIPDPLSDRSDRIKNKYEEEKQRQRIANDQARIRAKLTLANMELPTADMKPLEPARKASPKPYSDFSPLPSIRSSSRLAEAAPKPAVNGHHASVATADQDDLLAATPALSYGQSAYVRDLLDEEQAQASTPVRPQRSANDRPAPPLELDPLTMTTEQIIQDLQSRPIARRADPFAGLDTAFGSKL